MVSQPVQRRLQFVVFQYDIPPVKEVSLCFFGMANEVFVITTEQGKYVLKHCFKRNTQALVENEVALIEHLNSHQCPTPSIVPAKNGQPYIEFDGGYYVMTEFIDQRTITWNEPDKMRFLPQTVRALASFHKAGISFDEPHRGLQLSTLDMPAYLDWLGQLEAKLKAAQSREVAQKMLKLVPKLRQCAEKLSEVMSRSDLSALKQGYVHGDMHCFNLFFDQNDQYTYMVDFDFARFEYRMADIYWTSQILFYQQLRERFTHEQLEQENWTESEEVAREIINQNWSAIIKYYRQVLAIDDAELRLVGLFVQAVPMYISRFFSLDNSDEECDGHVSWFERELSLVDSRAQLVSEQVGRILDNLEPM